MMHCAIATKTIKCWRENSAISFIYLAVVSVALNSLLSHSVPEPENRVFDSNSQNLLILIDNLQAFKCIPLPPFIYHLHFLA
jgi:hypothetical protein